MCACMTYYEKYPSVFLTCDSVKLVRKSVLEICATQGHSCSHTKHNLSLSCYRFLVGLPQNHDFTQHNILDSN